MIFGTATRKNKGVFYLRVVVGARMLMEQSNRKKRVGASMWLVAAPRKRDLYTFTMTTRLPDQAYSKLSRRFQFRLSKTKI